GKGKQGGRGANEKFYGGVKNFFKFYFYPGGGTPPPYGQAAFRSNYFPDRWAGAFSCAGNVSHRRRVRRHRGSDEKLGARCQPRRRKSGVRSFGPLCRIPGRSKIRLTPWSV